MKMIEKSVEIVSPQFVVMYFRSNVCTYFLGGNSDYEKFGFPAKRQRFLTLCKQEIPTFRDLFTLIGFHEFRGQV